MKHATRLSAAAMAAMMLSGCGGGGEDAGLTPEELDTLRSDPRVERAFAIAERADSLLASSSYARYSLSAQGVTTSDREIERFTCSGVRCVGDDFTEITVADLLDPDVEVVLTDAQLGRRGGFDTATTRSRFRLPSIDEVRITSLPSSTSFGLWGTHGYAAIDILDGPIAGEFGDVPFSGDASLAVGYTLGDATGSNPRGVGGARWEGIAEAASTRTFQRRAGTATLTIADLSVPRIGVDIDVAGYAIGSPAWADIPLHAGRFATGTQGRDYVDGKFHGPAHEEAYGVFDTGAYVGAFGAKLGR